MKKNILFFSKIIISLIQFPLWFIDIFYDVGQLYNQDTGEIEKIYFYHSMYENISDLELLPLFYISITICLFSFVFSVVSFVLKKDKLYKISNIISFISIVLFIALLVVASTVARGY